MASAKFLAFAEVRGIENAQGGRALPSSAEKLKSFLADRGNGQGSARPTPASKRRLEFSRSHGILNAQGIDARSSVKSR